MLDISLCSLFLLVKWIILEAKSFHGKNKFTSWFKDRVPRKNNVFCFFVLLGLF